MTDHKHIAWCLMQAEAKAKEAEDLIDAVEFCHKQYGLNTDTPRVLMRIRDTVSHRLLLLHNSVSTLTVWPVVKCMHRPWRAGLRVLPRQHCLKPSSKLTTVREFVLRSRSCFRIVSGP